MSTLEFMSRTVKRKKALANILWPRAIATLKNMLHARGFDSVDEVPVWDPKNQKWWMNGRVVDYTAASKKPSMKKAINTCTVLLLDSKGCVGKQNVAALVEIYKKVMKTSTWKLGNAILIHTSRISSDGASHLAKSNIEVFDVATLQFDVMKVNNQHGILLNLQLISTNVAVDGPERHWLATDPVARYYCFEPGDKITWQSVSLCCPGVLVPWCAVVVTKPLN